MMHKMCKMPNSPASFLVVWGIDNRAVKLMRSIYRKEQREIRRRARRMERTLPFAAETGCIGCSNGARIHAVRTLHPSRTKIGCLSQWRYVMMNQAPTIVMDHSLDAPVSIRNKENMTSEKLGVDACRLWRDGMVVKCQSNWLFRRRQVQRVAFQGSISVKQCMPGLAIEQYAWICSISAVHSYYSSVDMH